MNQNLEDEINGRNQYSYYSNRFFLGPDFFLVRSSAAWVSPKSQSAALTRQLVSENVAFTCTAILPTSDIMWPACLRYSIQSQTYITTSHGELAKMLWEIYGLDIAMEGESGKGRRKVMEYCLRNLLYFLRVYLWAAGVPPWKQLWYHDAVLVSSCGFIYGRVSDANY